MFVQAVRTFQLELRAFMYPRVVEPMLAAPPRSCDGCPGRLTFTDYAAIPRFAMVEPPPWQRAADALRTAAWQGLLAILIALLGIGRAAQWAIAS
jgi:hypothetical protein